MSHIRRRDLKIRSCKEGSLSPDGIACLSWRTVPALTFEPSLNRFAAQNLHLSQVGDE